MHYCLVRFSKRPNHIHSTAYCGALFILWCKKLGFNTFNQNCKYVTFSDVSHQIDSLRNSCAAPRLQLGTVRCKRMLILTELLNISVNDCAKKSAGSSWTQYKLDLLEFFLHHRYPIMGKR